ncbi:HNH endonuclease [Marseillevirus marseillevirus]|uniref:HNH endonuclease n=1 Tax=Marseillevirus marseillevirus TaxID=694581 RepID=D2XB23_GBMV|nr:HNH endonuclease [Marseillevirus marseillevirus]ADB04150.1 HNH endonuclease [Marseillevirus marseillevirus]
MHPRSTVVGLHVCRFGRRPIGIRHEGAIIIIVGELPQKGKSWSSTAGRTSVVLVCEPARIAHSWNARHLTYLLVKIFLLKKRERNPKFFVLPKMCDCGEEEMWKVIEGTDYKVSSCGRVKDESNNILPVKNGMVRLPNKSYRIGRLVAFFFLENPEALPIAKRKTKDVSDNHASNFYWTSRLKSESEKKRKENSHPIEQWSLDGKFLKVWKYRSEILENIPNVNLDNVRACYMGRRITHAGFVWKKANDSIEGEIWRDSSHSRCPSLTKVSSLGRLRLKNGEVTYGRKDEQGGYMKLNSVLVHRLVAEAFCEGKTKERCVVNHKNKKRTDNRAENLEWVTHAHNSRHSYFAKENRENPSLLEKIEGEIWKDIDGIPGYKVSNKGRIAGEENFLLRYYKTKTSTYVPIKSKHYRVKRLVALAFVPNPENKKNVHCVDGNIENLCAENLQWCNRGEEKARKTQRAKKKDRIVQLSMDGEILNYWSCKEEAALKVPGTTKTGIEYTLWKRYPSCGGYLWRWEKSFDLPGEVWKTASFKGKEYTVSSFGRILLPKGTKTYGSPSMEGYCQYDGQKIHRIVATAFLPPPLPSQTQVNHIDGQKDHNAASNLEWVTPSRNIRHAHESGLISLPDRS